MINPLESLCYYDVRNPHYIFDDDEPKTTEKDRCYCDNCFYNKTELAEEIIKLNEFIKRNL